MRQEKALALMMANIANRKALRPRGLPLQAVGVWSQEWDETRALFWHLATTSRFRIRGGYAAAPEQTFVHRSTFHLTVVSAHKPEAHTFTEEWIAPIRIVAGTSAPELYPAIISGVPKELNMLRPQATCDFAKGLDAFVYQPTSDKASSNLSVLKLWGKAWQDHGRDSDTPLLLYFPETCQVHSHHRGKLTLKSLQFHTTRHFSLCNLYKLPAIQAKLVAEVEASVEQRLQRVVEKPPDLPQGRPLEVFFEIVYHLRLGEPDDGMQGLGVSKTFIADVRALLGMANGDVTPQKIKHHCKGTLGKSCCGFLAEAQEKMTTALLNLLLGNDGIPRESRWTNLLPNMKRTMTRQVVFGIGASVFGGLGNGLGEETQVDSDNAGRAEYLAELNGVRVARARVYFEDSKNMHELGVLTILLDVCDRLLYKLLGGVDRKAPPSKIPALIDKKSTPIGQVLSGLLHLLDSWLVGGVLRRPWCVLEMLKAPIKDAQYALWARCQVLRMAAALFRRYELKYSTWPYKLIKVCSPQWGPAMAGDVAAEVVAERECCLDVFTRGIKGAFPSASAIQSDRCKAILTSSFEGLRVTTDWCERQNAEVQALRKMRGRGLDFTNFSRENVHQQTRVAHLRSGGQDPTKPASLMASAQSCDALMMPFLPPVAQSPLDPITAPPVAGGSPQPLLMDRPPLAAADVGHGALGAAEESEHALVAEASDATTEASGAVLVRLDAGEEKQTSEQEPPTKRRGLNPSLAFRNQFLKTAKETKGRSLSVDEVKLLGAQAKQRWESIPDKSVYEALYQDWRETQPDEKMEATHEKPYVPLWGGGTRGSPISALELYQHHQDFGWPSDAEVFAKTEFHTPPDHTIDFAGASDFDLWGCRRSALAVCKASLASRQDFDTAHKGMCNYLDKMPRAKAESAGVMVMVEGVLRPNARNLAREIVVIVGTSWSPKVFEVALCYFEREEAVTEAQLALPFDVCLSRRERNG